MAATRNFILCSVLSSCVSAVTVIPLMMNLPKPYENPTGPAKSDSEILRTLHANTKLDNLVFISSFSIPATNDLHSINESLGIYASQDSFVRGAIDASATHQHLVIEPQDVWLTVLKQLSSYLKKHQDDKGMIEKWDNRDKKFDTISGLFPFMINLIDSWMEVQFRERDKTNWLLDWVRPNVGTLDLSRILMNATDEDMIAKALMMASSTKATEDLPAFPCENGIPSITLLGTRADWKNISDKLDPLIKLNFGKEPALYATMLRPILSRFVETFDKPNDLGVREFWSDIITLTPKQKFCRTTDLVTGWINAFHYWDGAGNLVSNTEPSFNSSSSGSKTGEQVQSNALVLDNITYPWRHRKDLPTFYSHTAMCMWGDTLFSVVGQLLVGMMAKSVKKGIPEGYKEAMKEAGFKLPSSVQESDHSILKPLPAFIYHMDAGDNKARRCG